LWLTLPADYVLRRSLATLSQSEASGPIHEGVTEVVAVTEIPGRGRMPHDQRHAMSYTVAPLPAGQCSPSLAHIPLLYDKSATRRCLVNRLSAAATQRMRRRLPPAVELVDVADRFS